MIRLLSFVFEILPGAMIMAPEYYQNYSQYISYVENIFQSHICKWRLMYS